MLNTPPASACVRTGNSDVMARLEMVYNTTVSGVGGEGLRVPSAEMGVRLIAQNAARQYDHSRFIFARRTGAIVVASAPARAR